MVNLKSTLQIIIYTLVFIVCCYIFSIQLFPTKEVTGYLVNKLKKSNPDMNLILGSIKLGYDLKFKIAPLVLADNKTGAELVRVKEVLVSPRFRSLLGFQPGFHVRSNFGKGEIIGDVNFPSSKPLGVAGNFEISSLDLSSLNLLEHLLGYAVKGIVNGNMRINAREMGLANLNGRFDLKFSQIKIPVKNPSVGLSEIVIEQGSCTGGIENGVMKIDSMPLKSKDISLDLTGKIGLKADIGSSTLNLTLNMLITPKFVTSLSKDSPLRAILEKKTKSGYKIKLNITGTLQNINWQVR